MHPFAGTSQAFATARGRSLLLWQFREGLVDVVEETLGVCLVCGGATLILLEVAQGSLGICPRAEQHGALLGRLLFPSRRLGIHESHVETHDPCVESIPGLFKILCSFLAGARGRCPGDRLSDRDCRVGCAKAQGRSRHPSGTAVALQGNTLPPLGRDAPASPTVLCVGGSPGSARDAPCRFDGCTWSGPRRRSD